MHLLGGATLLLAPTAATKSPGMFVGILLVHMLCYMPTLGLSNSLAFHHVTNPEKQFPLIRVFGTIGWIAANLVVSSLLHADKSAQQFYVSGAAAILLGLYSFVLPHTPPPAAGKHATIADLLGLRSLALLKQVPFAVFILSSFLICIPLSAYYSQAAVFVGHLGFEQVATTMSFGQMSEIFFMLVMPLFFARLGVKYMLLVGMIAWVARYGLFAFAADSKVQWMAIIGIVLHGICYDFFFVTGQIYVDKKAPEGIRGQAQGFLVLVTQGFGLGIGAQVIGKVKEANTTGDTTNWHSVFIAPCIMAAVIAVFFFLAFREKSGEIEPATV
jgi:nucleoside transporter